MINKIAIYILLILVYLGFTKSCSVSENKTFKIESVTQLSSYFTDSPISIILVDSMETGFLIKTYYIKLKIFFGFRPSEELLVRIPKSMFNNNKQNIGLSIFRRSSELKESKVPMPPGVLFVGSNKYGRWKKNKKGKQIWSFNRNYKHFPKELFWKDFKPDYAFYEKANIHLQSFQPFFGLNNEFGTTGTLTLSSIKRVDLNKNNQGNNKGLWKKYFQLP